MTTTSTDAQTDQEKMLIHLKELEVAAEDVLSDKQEIVDLDRKRNLNREALRALDKDQSNSKSSWVAMGNTFLKLPKEVTKQTLKRDQNELDRQINVLRSELKGKVNRLRDLEDREGLKGFELKAMSREDLGTLGKL